MQTDDVLVTNGKEFYFVHPEMLEGIKFYGFHIADDAENLIFENRIKELQKESKNLIEVFSKLNSN
jgi:hypothetical protein